jgi:hypothetical protein
VLGFSPVIRCVSFPLPPLVPGGGGHTRVGGSQFGQGDRHCGTLDICVLCVCAPHLVHMLYVLVFNRYGMYKSIGHVGGNESSISQTVLRLSALQRHCKIRSKYPRNENAQLCSRFPHSWSSYFAAVNKRTNRGNMEWNGNWERGRAVSFLGIHKSDLRCSVFLCQHNRFIFKSTKA